MSAQRILAAIVSLIAGWLLWGGVFAVNLLVSRGSSVSDALLEPPTSLLRLLSSGILLLGGLMLLTKRGAGRWLVLTGTILFSLLAGLMAASGADPALWKDEAVVAGILIVLYFCLVITKRS